MTFAAADPDTATVTATATATVHDAEVLELAARLRLSTTRLARRLRREAEVDLSPSMLSAVAMIHRHGPLTLGALAELEGVAPPTVTKIVNKLVDGGLVDRLGDPSDRRVCRVACTEQGETLLEASRRRKNAWLAARLEEYDDDDRRRLADAVEVLEALASGGSR